MSRNKEGLKNKIIYRATYRGTKEMDKLLVAFTKKYIDKFDNLELKYLSDLLDIDDENLFKFNQGQETSIHINLNQVSRLFKNFSYKND